MDAEGREKSTREKLIDAAEALFCEKGYEGVGTRELTSAAGVNIASINYHFKSKENLYREVVRRRISLVAEDLITAMKRGIGRRGESDLRKVISVYVTEYLNVLTLKEAGRFLDMISRDMAEGGMATDVLFNEMVAPVHKILGEAIRRAKPDFSDEKISLCIISIGGQIFHIVRARELIKRVTKHGYTKEFIENVASHITEFSIKGIEYER